MYHSVHRENVPSSPPIPSADLDTSYRYTKPYILFKKRDQESKKVFTYIGSETPFIRGPKHPIQCTQKPRIRLQKA